MSKLKIMLRDREDKNSNMYKIRAEDTRATTVLYNETATSVSWRFSQKILYEYADKMLGSVFWDWCTSSTIKTKWKLVVLAG